jgi:hypothetical protein
MKTIGPVMACIGLIKKILDNLANHAGNRLAGSGGDSFSQPCSERLEVIAQTPKMAGQVTASWFNQRTKETHGASSLCELRHGKEQRLTDRVADGATTP